MNCPATIKELEGKTLTQLLDMCGSHEDRLDREYWDGEKIIEGYQFTLKAMIKPSDEGKKELIERYIKGWGKSREEAVINALKVAIGWNYKFINGVLSKE